MERQKVISEWAVGAGCGDAPLGQRLVDPRL